MDLTSDLKVAGQSERDLQEVLGIAAVSAYRCPPGGGLAKEDEEFQIAWS